MRHHGVSSQHADCASDGVGVNWAAKEGMSKDEHPDK